MAEQNAPKLIRRFPAGDIAIPPSKSLSHRAVICAGLAALWGNGQSRLEHLGDNEDIDATLGCMRALGVRFKTEDGVVVVDKNPKAPHPAGTMDCGESGSTLRFLLPVAALWHAPATFTGRGRLMERPLDVYEALFREKGLRFERGAGTLRVQGPLPPGDYCLPGDVSSQFISGLLLALPLLGGNSRIRLSSPLQSAAYVALTLEVMRHFGVEAKPCEGGWDIPGGQCYRPAAYRVEGDWSQAAFFLAAGALGRPVRCIGMVPGSPQGDAAIMALLEQMGAQLHHQNNRVWARPGALRAIDADVRNIPDLVPPLAVLCSLANGTSHITGAGRLRLKESDRLQAMATGLSKLGAKVVQGPDSLAITGRPCLDGGATDACGDHRIAMAMAVAAIRCKGPVTLAGWQHVAKSYPHFWHDFEKEAHRV